MRIDNAYNLDHRVRALVSGILFSKTVRNSIVIPAQAGIPTEYANYVLHFHLVGYKESTSSSQHGFPLSREVVSGNAGNDGFSLWRGLFSTVKIIPDSSAPARE
ncbi:hypothetical protein GPY61_05275 [Massilia sp. NEAU-DD11]|uniref:Uncharacterized protein n=1 Tax=Massilia cellulosiltytica TaxID=2683234 RepID=A0A7X3FWH2_9BURK|nr:hypothetical protein [Telluria cellulosilytica]MVW59334.1 hypothetical protein [Telluria cellulosilytica]